MTNQFSYFSLSVEKKRKVFKADNCGPRSSKLSLLLFQSGILDKKKSEVMYCVVQRSVHSMACIIKVREPSLTASYDNDAHSSSLLLARQPLLTSAVTTTFLQQAFVLTRLRQCCDDLIVRHICHLFIAIHR